MSTLTPLLNIRNLKVAYGGIHAVKGIDIDVFPGELVSLIGANGAGKTTTMKALTGLHTWAAGNVTFAGESLQGIASHDLVKRGLVMVPEGRGVFARMTIRENLLMGAYLRNDAAQVAVDEAHMFALFPRLKERAQQLAGTLSGGEQQMLAMARALMSKPKLLLLDEPSMGLSPIMVEKIFEVIQDVSKQGMTILLVEQNARMALKLAQRAYVWNRVSLPCMVMRPKWRTTHGYVKLI